MTTGSSDSESGPQSVAWVRQLAEGDSEVVAEFLDRYIPSLQRLARSNMIPALRRRVGEDEIANSVCRTFLRRAQNAEFELRGSSSLWSLLCAITLTKVRHYARFHFRQKRRLDREIELKATDDSEAVLPKSLADQAPTPAEALEFVDQMQHLIASLGKEERRIVEMRLQGLTQAEIADKLSCSVRTIRRLLSGVRQHWEETLTESLDS